MVTKRCRQKNLHEMSYTIKYRVKARMATEIAVSTEKVKVENHVKISFIVLCNQVLSRIEVFQ